MGAIQEGGMPVEIAASQDALKSYLAAENPVTLSYAEMIGATLFRQMDGEDPQVIAAREAFNLRWREARGIVAVAQARKCEEPQHDEICANRLIQEKRDALVRAAGLVDKIVQDFDKYKIAVASEDPLFGTLPPYNPGEVGPGM